MPDSLVPHAVCWAAAPRLIWTMVVTNFITFASYLSICCTLLFLARRTGRVIAREWRFFLVGFALFIVACGSTHLLEVVTTWSPIFWVDAWTNIVTAALSAYVAIALIRRAASIGFGVNDYAARLADTVNENRRMEDSLLSARKLEDWSRMSAVVAHEISNPLEAIQNLLFLIRSSDDVSPEIVGLAETASAEAQRVMTISRSTLSFFRQTNAPESIDLLSAAESVRFLLDHVLQEKSIAIDIHASGDLVVEAFSGETRQVLLNLVRNACEATTHCGANVTIKLTGRVRDVEIAISDQGTGIDPALMPSLFQFGRSTKGEQGNGMGLWTVKHILMRHGGEITVQSKPGVGTTFTLHWPRRVSNPPAEVPMQGALTHS
jgi:signal transduction histidine kinase